MALSLDWVGAWARATERELGEEAFQRDVAFLARLVPLMELWSRYFDAEVRGLEHVPASGPVLLVNRHHPPVNVIVSCVPGPRTELGWPGGTLEAIYSVGPLIEGTAINVTAWSYVDRLCVGTLTCPDLAPDPHALAAGMNDALAELVAAAKRAARERASSSG